VQQMAVALPIAKNIYPTLPDNQQSNLNSNRQSHSPLQKIFTQLCQTTNELEQQLAESLPIAKNIFPTLPDNQQT